ncbi:DNA polymerase III subunit beta [Rhodothermus marinus]|uniref:Beta sliding clamp n=1 Tax=Rhodothermus marinus (strain ATCC 43812 / DSM 4252 / R-10) TaxID=518766 RepID=D0MJZ8_RHOM4|nr:DNA polymerase III subunit beta [Rhodothermus marinus]ACY46911.1 DNA polymerase III, beta subunit [Rhodothermus marinus DSM 4252]
MRFTVSSNDLLKALTAVAGVVPSKATMPILECILFEAEDGALRLSATDLEISIVERLPIQLELQNGKEGARRVAVPARRLLETLRALPDLPVQFSADESFNVTLTTDQGHYKMVGFDGADYPALPELDEAHSLTVDAALLRRAIQKTAFAVSKDTLRPAMMGIFFQVQPEEGRVVATDGHRLVRLRLRELVSETPLEFIVPEKATSLVAKLAAQLDGTCTIRVDERHVAFEMGPVRIISRLIDEVYPNYEAVIPVENDRRLVVDRDAFLSAVKRVGLYASSTTNQVRLTLEPDHVEIAAEDIERASEAYERVPCAYDGEPMVIGFNAGYLTEVLGNVDSDEVVLEFSSPNRAGVVMPHEQAEGEDLLMLIMPVMLNTYA